jgi:hypothetical protein
MGPFFRYGDESCPASIKQLNNKNLPGEYQMTFDIKKIPVSVCIIRLNEAGKIATLLNQLRIFEEFIVVDCGSTDQAPVVSKVLRVVSISPSTTS